MALLRCPKCREIVGDDPAADAGEPDGTAIDTAPCLECWEQDA